MPGPSRGSSGGTWEMVDPGEEVDHHVRDTGVANNFTNPDVCGALAGTTTTTTGLFSGDIGYYQDKQNSSWPGPTNSSVTWTTMIVHG